MTKPLHALSRRNLLIVKIASFLGLLGKRSFEKLLSDLTKHNQQEDVDVLKLMKQGKYLSPQDINVLRHICLKFATKQEGNRFGELCLSFNFLTRSNLELALEEQKRLATKGLSIRLGDLLVDAGMLSKKQQKLILQKQKIAGKGDPDQTAHPLFCPSFDPNNVREIRDDQLVLLVQNDGLKAFLKKTDAFDPDMLLADLKFLLEKNGIIYGLVDDDHLTKFIAEPGYSEHVFEAANGLAPVDGTDASVVYIFETNYLQAGLMSEDGSFDFKNRGSVPFVSKGDVLAHKTRPRHGKDGVNIFGDTIEHIPASDLKFNIGKGVQVSEDGSQVIAAADGNPKAAPDGEISVVAAYFIEGDVDYTTGHIKFDKNVYITGTIKDGFRVEAIDVVAQTIDGGIIKAQGNVLIEDGVVESTIESKGSIKAGFIHSSKIIGAGNVDVTREIVDTDIISGGVFDMRKGKLYSSTVSTKDGAKVYSIGSEMSKPSHITVGTSLYIDNQMKQIDRDIEKHQNLLDKSSSEKNRMNTDLAPIQEALDNFEHSQQRTLAMIEDLKAKQDTEKIETFQKSLNDTQKKIHDLQDKKSLIDAQLQKIQKDVDFFSSAVTNSVNEKLSLRRLVEKNNFKPVLDVYGKAFAGTKVSSRNCYVILSENVSRSRIMERNTSHSGTRTHSEMMVTGL